MDPNEKEWILQLILCHIRNIRPLQTDMMQSICNMSDNDKIQIIIAYNSVIEWLIKIL